MAALDADRTRSLTYAEMAHTMAITMASAKNLTRRKRWPRVRTNEGLVRVLVPLDYLANGKREESREEGHHASPHERLADGHPNALGTVEAIAALERHVARLEAALQAAETALVMARTAREEAHQKAAAEAVTTAAEKAFLAATLEAVRSERDRLLLREAASPVRRSKGRFWWRWRAG